MSPEYAMDGIFSVKSDVFSFGVLVLEIVSGKKNRGVYYSGRHLNLLAYVSRRNYNLYIRLIPFMVMMPSILAIDLRRGVSGKKTECWKWWTNRSGSPSPRMKC